MTSASCPSGVQLAPECEQNTKLHNLDDFLEHHSKLGRRQRLRNRKKLTKSGESTGSDYDAVLHLHRHLGKAGWRNESRLVAREFALTGRGLSSKRELRKGDCLISLPFDCLISLKTLESDSDFSGLFSSIENYPKKTLSFQAIVAFYIVFHRHKTQSPHKEYIQSIPSSFTTPFFCSKNELHFLPDAILEKIVAQNQELKIAHELLTTNLCTSKCKCCGATFFPDICSLHLFKWAYFAVNSRCVYVDPEFVRSTVPNSTLLPLLKDEPKFALAPFLDLFNHSDSARTTSKISLIEPFRYELFTLRSYPRYEQLFISYGQLPNAKLLGDYGFFLHDNQHDLFEFTLSDIDALLKSQKTVAHRNKFKFIKDHNLDQQMFVHCDDGPSHNLVVVLQLLFGVESVFPNVLSQIAFGSSGEFETTVKGQVESLVRLKMDEYRQFAVSLEKFELLSGSGKVVLGYLNECSLYLSKFLENYTKKFVIKQ